MEASSEVVEGFVTGVLVTTGEAMGESASEGMAEGADWQGGFSIATEEGGGASEMGILVVGFWIWRQGFWICKRF